MPDDPKNLFLQYYGDYLEAKARKDPLMTWLKAVHCRAQLQKIGSSPDEEEQICRNIFSAFVGEPKAEEIYKDLHKDSKFHPGIAETG